MFAEIAIPKTNLDTLTYSIPSHLESSVIPGTLVKINLKEKVCFGIVIEKNETTTTSYTKDIIEVIDSEFLSKDLLSLIAWAKKYYFAKWGQVLNLTIPQSVYNYKLKPPDLDNEIIYIAPAPTYKLPEFPAIRKIISTLKDNCYKTFLLFNPINNNSVEIYLRLIEENLRLKKSAIMLVPEIILTPKFITRFKERLGDSLFCFHSGLKLSERKKIWHIIKRTDYSVVLGTRSAIFAPVKNLGLIIIDNEHDLSYKEQERHFHFNARDIAVVRAQISKAVTVLASPTPSCESFYNAQTGKYELIKIPGLDKKTRGQILLIDIRRSKDKILSPQLKYEIKSAHTKGKQIVLFLNRRGYARVFSCFDCGYIPTCPQCGIPLIFHSDGKSFVCHICKYKEAVFDYCPKCKGNDFTYQGIGTQKIESEVKQIIHNPDILRIDSDAWKNSKLKTQNSKISRILITTRLGLSGLDYSQLGLFGVISADTTLFLPDFRAQERTFQELSKIIEQSLIKRDCKVLIQTYHPDNFAIYRAVQGDYLKFYEQELETRKKLSYPPFVRLALIKITSSQKNDAEKISGSIIKRLNQNKNLTALGPSLVQVFQPRTIFPDSESVQTTIGDRTKTSKKLVRGRPNIFTYQILVKINLNVSLSNLISLKDLASDRVKVDIDIDPM
jgi:primosomal protein N'